MELPKRASGQVTLDDTTNGMRASITLRSSSGARLEDIDGIAIYRDVLGPGVNWLHRAHAEGIDDFIIYPRAPAREELIYDLELTGVAGLRLVSSTLELLDVSGVPRLRMAPPYAIDSTGRRYKVSLSVGSCAADTSPLPPWRRLIAAPCTGGVCRCEITLDWSAAGLKYPAMVDPAWTTTGSMMEERLGAAAVVLSGGEVLVTGGAEHGSVLATTEIFNPASCTSEPAQCAWAMGPEMSFARRHHTATRLSDGRVMVAGGTDDVSYHNSAEITDTNGEWQDSGVMALPRKLHTATILQDGRILIAGGEITFNKPIAQAELFDPQSGWAQAKPMATSRSLHTADRLPDGRVLVIGGWHGSDALESVESFDPLTNEWTEQQPMSEKRYLHASILLDGGVLVTGGSNVDQTHDGAEIFELAPGGAGSWKSAHRMNEGRAHHAVSLLPGGRALVTGGCRGFDKCIALSEVFSPANGGSWSRAGDLAHKRFGHVAAPLLDGRVLVAGGAKNLDDYLSEAEVFSLLSTGSPCSAAGECDSGVCVANLCCDSLCDAPCMACTAKKKGAGEDGICGPIKGCTPPASPPVCEDEHTLLLGDGGTEDCSPFRCVPDAGCLTSCNSNVDCLPPASCGVDLKCEEGALQSSSLGCGCALAAPQSNGHVVAGSCLLLIMLAARRSRRGSRLGVATALGALGLLTGCDSPTPIVEDGPEYPALELTWMTTSGLVEQRTDATINLWLHDGLLIAGGVDSLLQPLDTVEIFDPQHSWFQGPVMKSARTGHTATQLQDGRIVVAGGSHGSGLVDTFEVLDPNDANPSWKVAGNLLTARKGHAAVALNGNRILIVGGINANGNSLLSTEVCDPDTPVCSLAGPLNIARAGLTATLIPDNRVLAVGGKLSPKTCELFTWTNDDPTNGMWLPAEPPLSPYSGHTASLLPDGRVLVVGSAAKIFTPTPEGGSWSSAEGLSQPRSGHTATILQNHDVLVVGSDSAERFSVADMSWSFAGFLNEARSGHVAGLTGNLVIVAGGTNDDFSIIGSTEVLALLPNGEHCGDSGDCLSGFCIGGICCNTRCSGPCLACDALATGQPQDGTCALRLNDPCLPTGYRCESTGECRTTCSADAECADAFACVDESCEALFCDGKHTLYTLNGESRDCLLFACTPENTCLKSCTSHFECAEKASCNANNKCEEHALTARDYETCVYGYAERRAPHGAAAVGLACLLMLARRSGYRAGRSQMSRH